MKSIQSKPRNTREEVKYSISQLYSMIERLQTEMAIMHFLHKDEINDMNLVHEQIANQVVENAQETIAEKIQEELNT